MCRDAFKSEVNSFANNMNIGHVFYLEGKPKQATIFFENALLGTNPEDFEFMLEDFETLTHLYTDKEASKLTNMLRKKMQMGYQDSYLVMEKLYSAIEQ